MEGSTFLPAAAPARTQFRSTTETTQPEGAECQASSDDVVRSVVLRVLARFPEAYAAVRDALRQAVGEHDP